MFGFILSFKKWQMKKLAERGNAAAANEIISMVAKDESLAPVAVEALKHGNKTYNTATSIEFIGRRYSDHAEAAIDALAEFPGWRNDNIRILGCENDGRLAEKAVEALSKIACSPAGDAPNAIEEIKVLALKVPACADRAFKEVLSPIWYYSSQTPGADDQNFGAMVDFLTVLAKQDSDKAPHAISTLRDINTPAAFDAIADLGCCEEKHAVWAMQALAGRHAPGIVRIAKAHPHTRLLAINFLHEMARQQVLQNGPLADELTMHLATVGHFSPYDHAPRVLGALEDLGTAAALRHIGNIGSGCVDATFEPSKSAIEALRHINSPASSGQIARIGKNFSEAAPGIIGLNTLLKRYQGPMMVTDQEVFDGIRQEITDLTRALLRSDALNRRFENDAGTPEKDRIVTAQLRQAFQRADQSGLLKDGLKAEAAFEGFLSYRAAMNGAAPAAQAVPV